MLLNCIVFYRIFIDSILNDVMPYGIIIIIVLAATRKEVKYSILAGTHIFQPLSFESHGPQNAFVISFINELSQRISQRSNDARGTQFLFQRLSVILQRFNAVLFGESFLAAPDDPDM